MLKINFPKKLYLYLIKKLFINFFLVIAAVGLLLLLINLFEVLDRASGRDINFFQIIILDLLQIPNFLEDIALFLIMLASMITISSFSVRSEITIIRASGISIFRFLIPLIIGSILCGIIFIFIFNPITVIANKKFSSLEQQIIKKESVNILEPSNGIWLKQENFSENKGEIIIRADRIYRDSFRLDNVNMWFFDEKKQFYKKIDAKKMFLQENRWHLQDVVINSLDLINQDKKSTNIKTNLKADFIAKKIINNFENVRLFSVYHLPELINNLQDSGFSTRKFVIYYHSLLSKPFIFAAMTLIAAFFSINNNRSKKNILMFVFGIISGLLVYISTTILYAFGSSGLLPAFLSTWVIAIILISIGILLIFQKEMI